MPHDAGDDITRLVLPAEEASPEAGDPLGGLGEELAEAIVPAPDAAAAWDVSSDELSDPFSTHVLDGEAQGPAVATAPHAAPAALPAFEDPLFDDDDAAAEFDLGEPAAVAPSPAAPLSAAPAPTAEPAAGELSDAMRTQMHETLEKIAWEALGDVSDRIVREAVARIEQVAWDVIPRLAETLIREEIRKLKGEQ